MLAQVLITPMGLGFEAIGPSPRHPNWTLTGYGQSPDDAILDYRNRYYLDQEVVPFETREAWWGQVEVPSPDWELSDVEPEPHSRPEPLPEPEIADESDLP